MEEDHTCYVAHALHVAYVGSQILVGLQYLTQTGGERLNLLKEVIQVGEGSWDVLLDQGV